MRKKIDVGYCKEREGKIGNRLHWKEKKRAMQQGKFIIRLLASKVR